MDPILLLKFSAKNRVSEHFQESLTDNEIFSFVKNDVERDLREEGFDPLGYSVDYTILNEISRRRHGYVLQERRLWYRRKFDELEQNEALDSIAAYEKWKDIFEESLVDIDVELGDTRSVDTERSQCLEDERQKVVSYLDSIGNKIEDIAE